MLAVLGVLALGAMATFCVAGVIGASVLDEQRFPTRYLHDVNREKPNA